MSARDSKGKFAPRPTARPEKITLGDFLTEGVKNLVLSAVEFGHAAAESGQSVEQAVIEARKTLNQELYNNCLAEAMKDRIM